MRVRAVSHRTHALTLIEAVVCMVIVGGLLVASLRALGYSGTLSAAAADRRTAALLAEDVLGEIRQMGYSASQSSADGTLTVRIGGISGAPKAPAQKAPRAAFTCVDEYDGLVDSPPTRRNGEPLPVSASFERLVSVDWALLASPGTVSATDSGLKRITVTVRKSGVPVLSMTELRAAAWPPVSYKP